MSVITPKTPDLPRVQNNVSILVASKPKGAELDPHSSAIGSSASVLPSVQDRQNSPKFQSGSKIPSRKGASISKKKSKGKQRAREGTEDEFEPEYQPELVSGSIHDHSDSENSTQENLESKKSKSSPRDSKQNKTRTEEDLGDSDVDDVSKGEVICNVSFKFQQRVMSSRF